MDGGRQPALATGAMTSKVKGQGAVSGDQSEPSWPNVSLEAGGAYCVSQIWQPHFLFRIYLGSVAVTIACTLHLTYSN